jgi:hypothetical protein
VFAVMAAGGNWWLKILPLACASMQVNLSRSLTRLHLRHAQAMKIVVWDITEVIDTLSPHPVAAPGVV